MKRRLKGRSNYYPGCLYGIAFTVPGLMLFVMILAREKVLTSKTSPLVIVFVVAFIAMYLIFSMFGKKLFAVTEKIFMRSGDAQKARIKAVITEFLVFFLFIFLICFVMPIIF